MKYQDEAPFVLKSVHTPISPSHVVEIHFRSEPILVGSIPLLNVIDADLNMVLKIVETVDVAVFVTSSASSALNSGICSSSGE